MNGIEKCRLLRQIRVLMLRRGPLLCDDNGLFFTEEECQKEHPGCRGTCPACELHLLSLNRMLEEMKQNGERINYDGIKELYAKEIESWRF